MSPAGNLVLHIAVLDDENAERGMGTLGLYLFDAPAPLVVVD